ncbi:MAG: hypothetical protein ABI759_22220 [Candidatus Solibacter sp.]
MASPAQIIASRANGSHSHGPSSVAGKAISSRNSLKLGITAQALVIPGEDPAELEQLAADYHRQYRPVGPSERALLQDVVHARWMKLRYLRIESELLCMRAAAHPDPQFAVAAAYEQDAKSGNALLRLFRRQQAADRDWRNALQTLEGHQRRRQMEAEEELPEPEDDSPDLPGSFCTQPEPPPSAPVARTPEPSPNLALRL